MGRGSQLAGIVAPQRPHDVLAQTPESYGVWLLTVACCMRRRLENRKDPQARCDNEIALTPGGQRREKGLGTVLLLPNPAKFSVWTRRC